MYDSSQELTALISARICHDLASPLGAIANGLELLELSGLVNSPEAALLSDSIQSATARIAFFRIAYGPASADAMVSPTIAQKSLAENYAERRISVNWGATRDCPRPTAKLLFLLIQAGETALPYGGDIEVAHQNASWKITCTGREVRCDREIWAHLTEDNTATPLQSAQVQFALARQQSKGIGVQVSNAFGKNMLIITIT